MDVSGFRSFPRVSKEPITWTPEIRGRLKNLCWIHNSTRCFHTWNFTAPKYIDKSTYGSECLSFLVKNVQFTPIFEAKLTSWGPNRHPVRWWFPAQTWENDQQILQKHPTCGLRHTARSPNGTGVVSGGSVKVMTFRKLKICLSWQIAILNNIFEQYVCMAISLICGWSGCGRGRGSTLLPSKIQQRSTKITKG